MEEGGGFDDNVADGKFAASNRKLGILLKS